MSTDWTHLQGCHADNLIGVIEEIGENVENGRFREDEFLHHTKGEKKYTHIKGILLLF